MVARCGDPELQITPIPGYPLGRYFLLGDNRNNSMDSRMPEAQGGGTVPFENLVGRAGIIFFSFNSSLLVQKPVAHFDRIGMVVR